MPLEYRLEVRDAETAVPELVTESTDEFAYIPLAFRLETEDETAVPVTGAAVAAPLELV